jgi:hypothetical protein
MFFNAGVPLYYGAASDGYVILDNGKGADYDIFGNIRPGAYYCGLIYFPHLSTFSSFVVFGLKQA